ncbi:unnamed protein product [Cyprideis torosa]|uniref:Uncharacterized protein n=1 Tax=Cyprideis torosa TaxID=163714 RepID=A0A7R8ZVA3_9CRUS|nr:unnamed protein product [Cyprideis torosa]CAG0909999.1 unnamed protein product [Cyprideis torosa]
MVNCPALPENVLESELFGYCRGAFTGAEREKKGLFQEADGSTIVLDEIGDIPISIQTKLLRVLQEKEIQPLGQNKTIRVDVRVVACTNQDLRAKMKRGEFREDLFYRLNVVEIIMPPLRQMQEDVPLLVHHFFERYKREYGRLDLELSKAVWQHLLQRQWQGNIRELENSMKRIVLLAGALGPDDLDAYPVPGSGELGQRAVDAFADLHGLNFNAAKALALDRFVNSYLAQLLWQHQGNVTRAAQACGLERQALQRVMRRHGIVSTAFKTSS